MEANSSSLSLSYHCTDTKGATLISGVFISVHVVLNFPLCLLVLCLGLQRWRQRRSFAATSHSDIFTYHWAAMELIFVFGVAVSALGYSFGLTALMTLGFIAMLVVTPGQMTFHVLTCVERYLAVVHPVTYLRMKQSGGVPIRNASIGCVWLLYCGWTGLTAMYSPKLPYVEMLCFLVFFLCVVSFCSLSVLCVLTHPGPGDSSVNRVDQSKHRAFQTILAITAVLWLNFLGLLASVAVDQADQLSYDDSCLVLLSGSFYGLPSSLVLPLLFLQRAGKLPSRLCSSE